MSTTTNLIYAILAGKPELELSTTSAIEATFTVPSGERWIMMMAGILNSSQASDSAFRISIDGTNFTPNISTINSQTSAIIGGESAPGVGFIVPSGGKIITRSLTFTAADTVKHFVLHQTIREG